jgi:hypothetical protein
MITEIQLPFQSINIMNSSSSDIEDEEDYVEEYDEFGNLLNPREVSSTEFTDKDFKQKSCPKVTWNSSHMSDRSCRRKGNMAYKSTEESMMNDAHHGVFSDGTERARSAMLSKQNWIEERTANSTLIAEQKKYAEAKAKLKLKQKQGLTASA